MLTSTSDEPFAARTLHSVSGSEREPLCSDLVSNLPQQDPHASTRPRSWSMGVQAVAPIAASDLPACSSRWRSLRGGEGVCPPSTRPAPRTSQQRQEHPITLPNVTATGRLGANPELGRVGRAWARFLGAETMRVVQAVTVATDRAEDWASLRASISPGQSGYVPQLSPSAEASE